MSDKILVTKEEVEKIRASAWDEYDKIRDSARAEYDKIRDPAWSEFEKKLEKYEIKKDELRK